VPRLTGTGPDSCGRAQVVSRGAGFTLIELLVVVVIISLLITGAMLSLSSTGKDSQLETERDRLSALMQYARERGELQTREYGLRCAPGSYQFVVYDNGTHTWLDDDLDSTLAERKLPEGLELALAIEGRPIVLEKAKAAGGLKDQVPDLTPQIMLFSSGDTNEFELTLRRPVSSQQVVFHNAADGTIAVSGVAEAPR
jgi:type II secretion system protein H